jgi:hypothetical protein
MMPTNVTQKDQTLHEIIGWARIHGQLIDVEVKAGTYKRPLWWYNGYSAALSDVASHCKGMLSKEVNDGD